MKVWVVIAVLCLVCSTPVELSAWKTYLLWFDSSLPYTVPTSGKICYFYDITQTCSGSAISTYLGLLTETDIANWTPTTEQCDALLDAQRAYAEEIAMSLFPTSIASAKSAGVTNYDVMVQSWVLRTGYYQLQQDQEFIQALEGITDWTTVVCQSGTLLHDGVTTARPSYVRSKDCVVLSSIVPVGTIGCSNYNCPTSFYRPCCQLDCESACCEDTDEYDELC